MRFEKISKEQYRKDFGTLEGYDDLKLPSRATIGSAGYDFYAPYDFTIDPGREIKIPTGIRISLAPRCVLLLMPKSGLGTKFGMQLTNTIGVVDSDYYFSDNEGHIWACLVNGGLHGRSINIKKGQSFIQGIINTFAITEDDEVSDTRNGGFGSTTK